MSVRFRCEFCDRCYSVPDHRAGARMRCKECDAVIRVPGGRRRRAGESRSRRRDRKANSSRQVFVIGGVVAGVVLLLAVVWYLRRGSGDEALVAKYDDRLGEPVRLRDYEIRLPEGFGVRIVEELDNGDYDRLFVGPAGRLHVLVDRDARYRDLPPRIASSPMADSRTTDYAIPGANVWRRKLGGFAAAYAEFEDSGGGGGWYPIGAPGHHLLYCLHDGDRQVTIQAICDEGFDSEEFALLRASAATLVPATGEPALRQRLPGTRVELDVPREYVWNGAVFEDFDTSASEFVIGFDSSLAAAKLDSFIRQRALPGTTARIVERSNVQVSGHACSLQLYEFDAPPRTRRHRAWFALLQGDSASAAIIATFDPTKPGKGDRLRQAILGASWTPGRPLDPLADEPFRIDVPAGLRPAARLGPVLVLTGDGLFDPDDPQAPLLEIGIHPVSRHHSSPREAEQVVSGRLRGARTEWREETEFWSRRSAAISGADPRGRPVIGELMLKTEHSRSALLLALVPPDRADMLPAMKRTMDAFPW